MLAFFDSVSLLFAMLNPFLVVVYVSELMRDLDALQFRRVLLRAGLIATAVFCAFAILGTAIFSEVVRAEFASFQIFGGLVFVLIGLQFVFKGPGAIEMLRGQSAHIAGAVAMPVLIGPGTISVSIVIGNQLDTTIACVAVAVAVSLSLVVVLLLKALHDYVRPRREALVERYIEIAGRVTALYVGTVAVEMIMQGVTAWVERA